MAGGGGPAVTEQLGQVPGGQLRPVVRENLHDVAPRIGVAYRPWGNNTVFRTGFGVFYNVVPFVYALNFTDVPFLLAEPSYNNPKDNPQVILPDFVSSGPHHVCYVLSQTIMTGRNVGSASKTVDPQSGAWQVSVHFKNNEFVDQQVLFRAPKELYSQTNAHYGSRFIFDRQNHLFFTLGEKMQMMDAQDLSKPTGKNSFS